MAKYLDTSLISSELMQLLKEAKEKIILVTFSLKVNTQIQERLKTKSKLGTLSEITIFFGNPDLKRSEIKWMEEVDDLRIFQKKNLHAKCYINENKAIICSMNLYDYSQTTNIEMGFLITKEDDREAYDKLMDDIADLKINGTRIRPSEFATISNEKIEIKETIPTITKEIVSKSKLSYNQQIKKQLLEFHREMLSSRLKENSTKIITDENILDIVKIKNISIAHLIKIFNSEKKAKQIGSGIIDEISNQKLEEFTIGKILDTRYQSDDFSYDQVNMENLNTKSIKWYDTKKELPKKNQTVAVRLNGNWFNSYLILEEPDIKEESPETNIPKDYSRSIYKTTKELSESTGVSSREINSLLVSNGLMEKQDTNWILTKKGEKFGGNLKTGSYGDFIIWPEEILIELGI